MPDRSKINQMLLELSTAKQMRGAFADLNDDELKNNIDGQLDTLKNWIEASKIKKKSQLFANRTPIGTIIPQHKKLTSCYALQNPDSEIRPAINQIVFIYDPKYDDILSGIIQDFKPFKSGKKETLIVVIDLLFVHTDVKLRKRKKVTQLISDECLVFDTAPEEIEKIFGLPETGVKLGICSFNGDIIETKLGGPLYYLLNPELLKTHIMIGGVTGQGKTIFLKNLLYDLAIREFDISNNMTIFDLQGDLVQILEAMPESIIPKSFREAYNDLDMKEFHGLKEKIINEDILFLKPYYVKAHGFLEMFPWIDFGLNSGNIQTGEELVSLIPGLTKKGSGTLVQLYSMFMISRNSPFNFSEFYEFVISGVQRDEKGKKSYNWVSDSEEDSLQANASVGDAMIRQIKLFKNLSVFDNVQEIDIEELLSKKLVFVYFPDVQGYTQIRSIMLLDILSRIYYAKRHNIDHAIKNNLMVIDEAHELLPKKQKSSDLSDEFFNYIEKRFTRIAKEGRKYGISLVLSTQILSELNDEVKYNAQTRIFFKLSEKDMSQFNLEKDTIRLINGLKKGYAIVYSRDNLDIGRAIEMKVLPPVFLHCDPRVADKFFEEEVKNIKAERKKRTN